MRENESVVKFYSAQFLSLYLITKDQKEMGVKGFGRGTNKRSVCVCMCVLLLLLDSNFRLKTS